MRPPLIINSIDFNKEIDGLRKELFFAIDCSWIKSYGIICVGNGIRITNPNGYPFKPRTLSIINLLP